MSLSNTTAQVGPYTIASLPATLAVSFPFALGTDLLVQSLGTVSSPNDPPVTLTYNSDYTVTGGGFDALNNMLTGSVVCVGTGSHIVAVGERIVITLATPKTQLTGYSSTGALTVPMIERALDKLTNITKAITEGFKRTLRVPTSTTELDEIEASPFKSMVLGFDANMQPVPYAPTPGAAMPVATSSSVGTVKPDNSTTLVSASGVLSAPSGIIVASIAALRAMTFTGFADKTKIHVHSYYASAAPDGGGGDMEIDLSDTTTADNGATVFVASDGTRLKRPAASFSDVRQAGAKGNDSANDTSAIQAAITAVGRGHVHIPAGTYRYTALTIANGVKITGAGRAATILKTTSATGNSIAITTTDAVTIEGMQLSLTVAKSSGAYISVQNPAGENIGTTFRDISFESPYVGIEFLRASHWTVDNCYFNNYTSKAITVANATTPDSGDSTITNCFFYGETDTQIGIHHYSSGGLRIHNNKFLNGAYHYLVEPTAEMSDLLFQDNSSEHAYAANIAFTPNAADYLLINVKISDNEFTTEASCSTIIVNDNNPAWIRGLQIGENIIGLNDNATGIRLAGIVDAAIYPNEFRSSSTGTYGIVITGTNSGEIDIRPQTWNSTVTPISGTMNGLTTFIENSRSQFFSIASGASQTVQLANALQNSIAHVTIGGLVQSVGAAAGLYLVTWNNTVTTINAIANVAVTANSTNGTITITNNTGQIFDGKILVHY